MSASQDIINHIHDLFPTDRKIKIMNVCGSHEHTISFSGMRSALPQQLELIPGPGCPVCVCPESDILHAINLSTRDDVILVTYGDMLRVPTSKGSIRSAGKNFQMIASPFEAVRIARRQEDKKVVFFSIGFETTTAPAAALLEMGVPDNLYILSSHRLTPTIMEVLVRDAEVGIDGFVAPGHVSAIVGSHSWDRFSETYGIPTVVAGFDAENLLMGILDILRQLKRGVAETTNVYRGVVTESGNRRAQELMDKYFVATDANWRGIGNIAVSGLELRNSFAGRNARHVFALKDIREKKETACICGKVILGKAYPGDCRLFKSACRPATPKGPCMVSHEGACNIWYKTG